MAHFARRAFVVCLFTLFAAFPAFPDSTPHDLSASDFSQDWSNAALLTADDVWTGVPSIEGCRGDGLTPGTGTDAQTMVASDTPCVADVNVDEINPATFGTGGLAEFAITNPVVAFQGSGTADAPYLLLHLNTTGRANINVSFNARDIDGSTDDAVQQVAVLYRVGNSGNFTNLPTAFVADASTGPSLATLVTAVSVALPAGAENQPLVQVRIITTNAAGNDEWVGIDNILVTSTAVPTIPALSIDDVSVSEGNAGTVVARFTVSLSMPAGAGGVTFDIASADNTATTADNDYVASSLTGQTITPGNSTYLFDVTINGDTNIESTETFFANVTNITGATAGDTQGVGTILNDDSPPNLTIADVSQAEGNGATSTMTFTVTLDNPALAGGVTFDIATADDTATTGDTDYVANSATGLTIAQGLTSQTFDVTINGDTKFEANEQFLVNVTNVSGAVATDAQATGTITNDDAAPSLSIGDVAIVEGDSGTQLLTFTVDLSAASDSIITVDYATADSSATTADNDYVALATTTLTFTPGETSKTIDVTVNGDTNIEGDEQFFLNFSNPTNATLAVAEQQALGVIRLDDAFSIAAVNTGYVENFDSLADASFAATTPTGWTFRESGTAANVTYAAGNGGSNTGNSYSFGTTTERAFGGLQSGSLTPTFAAFYRNDTGVPITTLSIAYRGEEWRLGTAGRADRLDFQYSLDATSPTTGAWVNVDALDFTTPNQAVIGAKDGNAAGNFTNIGYTIGGLSIAPGATFWIRFNDFGASGADDGLAVDDFSLIANIAGGVLTIDDPIVTEGDAGTVTATFTVTLSQPAGVGGVTFDITTADNTATTADNDYVANSVAGALIAEGNTTYTFDVVVNGDTVDEVSETFFVNVTNLAGAAISDGQGVGTIASDDFTFTAIHDIQGNGLQSPLNGATRTIGGIVTGIKSGGSGGFFVQEEDAEVDADPNTSEGIFVFTSGVIPAGVAIGNQVAVTGTISEFPTASAPHTVTELGGAVSVSLLASGQPLPAPVTITAADAAPSTNLSQYERFEGMRVAATLTVAAPTDGSKDEPNATGSSNGVFYGVIAGTALPFREEGLIEADGIPSEAACAACIPRFDTNPQKFRVDSDNQPGATQLNVVVGQTVSNVVGVLDYGFLEYTILPEAATVPVVSGNSTYVPVRTPLASELTISSFNLERFYDTTDEPSPVGDAILTPTAFANRLNKASLAVRNVLMNPDVLGVVEVENLTTLQALATKINTDSGGATNYAAYLIEGNDIGGIDVGFLVNLDRVTVDSVTQEGKTATFVDPSDSSVDMLNDRPPLVLEATATRTDLTPYPFTVIVNHLRSLIDVEGDDAAGQRVRAKRAAQAEFLANLVQTRQTIDPTERIILVGDFNAFEVSDGLVDVIGTILGTPTPATDVVKASPDLVNPDLTNLVLTVPQADRWSFSFDGNLQVIDHAIANAAFLPSFIEMAYARLDAGFPEIFRGDPARPERVSDHDALVAYFSLSPLPTIAISDASVAESDAGTTLTFTVALSAASTTPVTVDWATGDVTATAGSDYTAANGTLTFAPSDVSETITITIAGDTVPEPDETFSITLSNVSANATITDADAVGTILNDDAAPATASLSLFSSMSPTTPAPGDQVTFTIIVTNNGPDAANDIVVTDDIPTGTTLVSATSTQGTCTAADPVVCSVGTLASGQTATITIVIQLPQGDGTFTNAVSATATEDLDGATLAPTTFTVTAAASLPAVPTLSEYALFALIALLGALALRRL